MDLARCDQYISRTYFIMSCSLQFMSLELLNNVVYFSSIIYFIVVNFVYIFGVRIIIIVLILFVVVTMETDCDFE